MDASIGRALKDENYLMDHCYGFLETVIEKFNE